MPVYLQLWHGRSDPNVELEDWGEAGPIFGPLQYVHTTYGYHVKFQYAEGDKDRQCDLLAPNNMLYYDGMWYGDWGVLDWCPAPSRLEYYNDSKSRPKEV